MARVIFDAVSRICWFCIRSSRPHFRLQPQSSVIYGYKQPDGRVIVVEGRAEGYYPPINESDPETTNNVGWFKDGLLGISFRRNRTVEAELWGNATNCPYFLFPYNGKRRPKYRKTPMLRKGLKNSIRSPAFGLIFAICRWPRSLFTLSSRRLEVLT